MPGYAIVVASGQLERLQAVGNIASIAAASDVPIDVFATMDGLEAFDRDRIEAMDFEMVTALARTGTGLGALADTASDPDTVRGLETFLTAVGEAADPDELPDRVGMIGLLGGLRDPEVQRGLGFLLSIARTTGRGLERQHDRD